MITRPPSVISTYRLWLSIRSMPSSGATPTASMSTYRGRPSQTTVAPWTLKATTVPYRQPEPTGYGSQRATPTQPPAPAARPSPAGTLLSSNVEWTQTDRPRVLKLSVLIESVKWRFSILCSWVGRRPQGGGWPWGAEWSHPAWAGQAAIYTYGSFGKSRDAGRRDA